MTGCAGEKAQGIACVVVVLKCLRELKTAVSAAVYADARDTRFGEEALLVLVVAARVLRV